VTSAVPAALTALHAAVAAAVTTADVFVGPPASAEYPDWIGLAYSPTGGEVVAVETTWAALGSQRFEESCDITCTIESESGDLDVNARRARVYELLDAVASALAADHTLDGAVRTAHVSGHTLVTDLDDSGLSESLRFTVHIDTRIGT
jgi:hypothetical protein